METDKFVPRGAEKFSWSKASKSEKVPPAGRHDLEEVLGRIVREPSEEVLELPLGEVVRMRVAAAPALEKDNHERGEDTRRREQDPNALTTETVIMRNADGSRVSVERSLDQKGELHSVTISPYGEGAQSHPIMRLTYDEHGLDIAEVTVERARLGQIESVPLDLENARYELFGQLDALELDREAMSRENHRTRERDKSSEEFREYSGFMASPPARRCGLDGTWTRTYGDSGRPSGSITYQWIDSETGRKGIETIAAEKIKDSDGYHGWKLFARRHPELNLPQPAESERPA